MSTEPNHINLYPELDDELDAAYEQAQQAQAGAVGITAVAASAMHEMAKNLSKEPVRDQDRSFEEALEYSRAAMEVVLKEQHLEVPASAEWQADLATLKQAYNVMKENDLEPVVVMAPVLPAVQWQLVYASLGRIGHVDDIDFDPDQSVVDDWDELNKPEGHQEKRINNRSWHLQVIPSKADVPYANTDFYGETGDWDATAIMSHVAHGMNGFIDVDRLPSPACYLALQAMLYLHGEKLMDEGAQGSWLGRNIHDEEIDYPMATIGYAGHDGIFRTIRMNCENAEDRSASAGYRPTVWAGELIE